MDDNYYQVTTQVASGLGEEGADIADVFAAHGIPLTRQRRELWRYFARSGRASTMREAIEDMRTLGIGQATVYRTVNMLADLGLLYRLRSLSGEVCYTATHVGHRHPLVCSHCRRVVEFDGEDDLVDLQDRLESETGFSVYGHQLIVFGMCRHCARGGQEGPSCT